MVKKALVLFPSPAIGHFRSMVELGKLILTHRPSYTIHVLIVKAPCNDYSIAAYISNVSATVPSIKFHYLPAITLPSNNVVAMSCNEIAVILETLHLSLPNVRQALLSVSQIYTVEAFIMDFSTAAYSVTYETNIPCYHFFTSGAGDLSCMLYLQTIHKNITESLKDLNAMLHIPGVAPIHSSDMPTFFLDQNGEAYKYFLDASFSFRKSAGIIVNVFENLEPKAVKAISDGLCIPDDTTPPIYCIGPLIVEADDHSVPHECLEWLDRQPSKSVVFLCFGSLGLFSKDQLRQIAIGLERSGHRFLWVVRNPPSPNDQSLAMSYKTEPDLYSLLPVGFLDRTNDRGHVVKLWAPQAAILSHESIGGFATHCGWNSILEAICAGVPMLAWPLYSEQRFNRMLMVEEMKIALPIRELENGFVSAEEVEKRVTELMDPEVGDSVRKQMSRMRNEAIAAQSKGGSSRVAMSKLVDSWTREPEK